MGFVTRQMGSGLVLAEQSADEAGLQRALRQIDDRLVLQKHPASVGGGWVYKVYRIVSDDQPAHCVCTWTDDHGRPLPLSSGLLDLVQSLRVEARDRRGPDADERNRRRQERVAKAHRDAGDSLVSEHRARVEKGRVSVGLGSSSKLAGWQRNRSLPGGGRRR